ncbi:MAG TPA: SDR family NAD(P)-dependent oxidoreductase, partial [bacterium]|nr:SDR family NAD(P)-dependent oxidoreductase [bacterium]
MGKLDAQVAIVTGGSGALGRAISTALAAEGAVVVVHYASHRNSAEAVVGAISEMGGRAASVQADLSAPEGARQLVAFALESFGKIDILVNNAGMIRDTLILRMKDEDWSSVLHTNLSSAFYCTKAVLREFVRQHGGRIINIASIVAEVGNPGQAN